MKWVTRFVLTLALFYLLSVVAWAQVEITFWHDWGGTTGELMDEIVQRFELEHPDIKVNTEITADLSEKLLMAIMGGIAPDVVLLDRWLTSSYAARGGLISLNELLTRDGVNPDDYFAPTWDEATFRGQSYGIPFNTDTRVLFYHEGMFLESGLDANAPPSTWQELRENAARVTRRDSDGSLRQVGYVPHWGQPNFVHYLWQNGGVIFNSDQTEVVFHGEDGVEALEWMVDFVDWYGGLSVLDAFSGTMQSQGPLPTLIGRYQAIHYDGNWNLGALRSEFSDFYHDSLRAALPPMNTQRATLSGGFALSLPTGTDQRKTEAAWKFIRYMTDFDAQLTMGVGTGNIPALKMAAMDHRYLDDEIRAVFIDAVQYAHFRPNHPTYPRIDEMLRGGVQLSAIRKEVSPRSALEDAARQAQSMLDEVNLVIGMLGH